LVERLWQRLDRTGASLISPAQKLQFQSLRIKALAQRLMAAGQKNLYSANVGVEAARRGLSRARPSVLAKTLQVERALETLKSLHQQQLMQRRARLDAAYGQIRALSPDHTLARGYSIIFDQSGTVVRSKTSISRGQLLSVLVADGGFDVKVPT
jgi:exodeoxyribonuclease VII large subunit